MSGDLRDEIGDEGRNKVTATVETLVDLRLLVIGGDNFFISENLMTLGTNH